MAVTLPEQKPEVWRITRLDGRVQYVDHAAMLLAIDAFNEKKMADIINEIGALYEAADVTPLYATNIPRVTLVELGQI